MDEASQAQWISTLQEVQKCAETAGAMSAGLEADLCLAGLQARISQQPSVANFIRDTLDLALGGMLSIHQAADLARALAKYIGTQGTWC